MANMIQSNFVIANGIRIHYLRTDGGGGNKQTLLLLHGITDSGACWTPVIEALQADYDCVAPDTRGHGQSDAPDHGYAPADHAADVADLIQVLDLKRPVVIGHSMGGVVATVLASQRPDSVRAVVLEDPAWFDLDQAQTLEMRRRGAEEWRTDLRRNQTKSQEELIANERIKNPRWSDAELIPWAESKRQVRVQALEWVEQSPPDWRALLKTIQCPLLLVTGDPARGAIISPDTAREAQALGRDAQVAHVSDAGHCIRRDNFAAFVGAVRSFLAGLT